MVWLRLRRPVLKGPIRSVRLVQQDFSCQPGAATTNVQAGERGLGFGSGEEFVFAAIPESDGSSISADGSFVIEIESPVVGLSSGGDLRREFGSTGEFGIGGEFDSEGGVRWSGETPGPQECQAIGIEKQVPMGGRMVVEENRVTEHDLRRKFGSG